VEKYLAEVAAVQVHPEPLPVHLAVRHIGTRRLLLPRHLYMQRAEVQVELFKLEGLEELRLVQVLQLYPHKVHLEAPPLFRKLVRLILLAV